MESVIELDLKLVGNETESLALDVSFLCEKMINLGLEFTACGGVEIHNNMSVSNTIKALPIVVSCTTLSSINGWDSL